MRSLALLPLLACSLLASEVPFNFEVITPEFTKSAWSQMLGVGVNYKLDPVVQDNRRVYQTNLWYTTGKGNPFTSIGALSPSNKHTLNLPYGSVTVSSVSNDSAGRTLSEDPYKLSIQYELNIPASQLTGQVFITLSANTPMPAFEVGRPVQLSVWSRGRFTTSKRNVPLTTSGVMGVFGGDIFTEQPMRWLLSYQYPDMIYGPTTYEVVTEKDKVIIDPTRVKELNPAGLSPQRIHSADSPRALEARRGFFVYDNWAKQQSETAFRVTDWDLSTGVISFEITFQLPSEDIPQSADKQWMQVTGEYELCGFKWW